MTHDQIDRMVRGANPLRTTTCSSRSMRLSSRPSGEEDGHANGQPTDDRGAWSQSLEWPDHRDRSGGSDLDRRAIFLLTKDDPPVAEPAPNATRLTGEDLHPIAPGAYFTDTDGDEGTTTRGTFVIEGNEWAGFNGGVLDDNEGGDIAVSMLVLQVDRVWEAPCDGGASAPAGTSAKALADQFAAMPGFTTLEGLTPVSAFGRDGYHLVLEVRVNCAGNDPNVWSSPAFLPPTAHTGWATSWSIGFSMWKAHLSWSRRPSGPPCPLRMRCPGCEQCSTPW